MVEIRKHIVNTKLGKGVGGKGGDGRLVGRFGLKLR